MVFALLLDIIVPVVLAPEVMVLEAVAVGAPADDEETTVVWPDTNTD